MRGLSKSKRFAVGFLTFCSVFLAFHGLVWGLWTSDLLAARKPYYAGDLARIGYLKKSLDLRSTEITLPKRHIDGSEWDGTKVDLITIGDSFSNGGGQGENPFYQDYIASLHDLKVLNVQWISEEHNYVETIMAWLQTGLLDLAQPKAVLIQTIERQVIKRFARPMNWDQSISLESLRDNVANREWGTEFPVTEDIRFINTANYRAVLYNLLYSFSPNALGYSKVFKHSLSTPLFSVDDESTLLVFKKDIERIDKVNEESVAMMNANFNKLATTLSKKGIKLYILIAPDKYDLYQKYIVDNPHPRNRLFEYLEPLSKNYKYIDAKGILVPLLEKGEKDVYFADDTHWSSKASEAIAHHVDLHSDDNAK